MKVGSEVKQVIRHNLFKLMADREIRSVAKVAELAGVNYKKLHMFANYNQKYMDPEIVAGVCKALNCKIEELLVLEEGE